MLLINLPLTKCLLLHYLSGIIIFGLHTKKKCMSTAKNQKIVNGLTIELTVQLKVYTVLQTATDNL